MSLAEWLSGASVTRAEPRTRYRACDYPGCLSAVLRGSPEISAWREISDASGGEQRRVLLCPEHAAAWDEHLRLEYLQRYGGDDPDVPVLRH